MPAFSLKTAFNKLMSHMGSMRHQVAIWAQDNNSDISYTERMMRVRAIINFLKEKTVDIADKDKDAFVEEHHVREIDYAEILLLSMSYTESTKDVFKHAEAMALLAYADRYDGRHAATHYAMARPEERQKTLQEISDLFFQGLGSHVPKLQSPLVTLSKKYDDASGWIYATKEQIRTKNFLPIYIHEMTGRFEDDINTVCHEATHHAMQQMAALKAHGDLRFGKNLSRDLDLRRMFIEHEAFGHGPSQRIYRADPDEQLAHRTGNAIQALYVASQNLGSIRLAWESFRNNEHLIDVYSAGKRRNPSLERV